MAKLIAGTYGSALFEAALEEKHIDELYDEVISLKEILKENPDFSKLLNHPKLTKEAKEELMESVFEGRASAELVGFLKIIIANDRYSEIFSILDYFIDEVKEYKGIGTAFVYTPFALSDAQKKAVEEKLLSTSGYKTMEMNYLIDESLIGGMVIRIGDRVVDSSIKSKLEALRKSLLNVQVNK